MPFLNETKAKAIALIGLDDQHTFQHLTECRAFHQSHFKTAALNLDAGKNPLPEGDFSANSAFIPALLASHTT